MTEIDIISEMILQHGMSRQAVAAVTGMTYNTLNRKFRDFSRKIVRGVSLRLSTDEIAVLNHCSVQAVEIIKNSQKRTTQ